MFNLENKAARTIGSALILSAAVFGAFYYNAQSVSQSDVLSVTGSTKETVDADQAKLIISLLRTVSQGSLSSGNISIARDRGIVRALLAKHEVAETEISEGPVSMNQMYSNDQATNPHYELRQTIIVQSADIQKVTNIAKVVPDLTAQGAIVSVGSLEYYYSKLPEKRVALLSGAIKDAQARAQMIAESTGRKVGNIRSASSGVVQVLPINSIEVSDYGSYDTSSIKKDIMVTVKASFSLK
ncbi:MAG: SIMPL domain-containing protein [Candidatus Pacebacteria bacterium]|jgi:hypothetical protein|nr:SIMPL domain-containing protein [Candidatus Paceibacterota bacterium]